MPSPAAGVRRRSARPERDAPGLNVMELDIHCVRSALDPGFQCVTSPAASAARASLANLRTTSTTSTGREVGAGDHRPLEVSDRRVGERDATVE